MDYQRTIHSLVYGQDGLFSPAEALALCPKGVRPDELPARYRVAQTISDLRHNRMPEYAPASVLQELRELVMLQLRGRNCYQPYKSHEAEALQELVDSLTGPEAWSKLVLRCGKVREKTLKRLDELEAAAYEERGYCYPELS